MAQLQMLDFLPVGYCYRFVDQRALDGRAIRHNAAVVEEREGGQETAEDPALHEDKRQNADGLTLPESEEVESPVSEGLLDDAPPAAQVIDGGTRMALRVVVPLRRIAEAAMPYLEH